jgi:hypothetical protein
VLGREDVKEVLEEIKKSLFFFYYAKNRYFNFEKFISEGITVKELIGDIWRELSIKSKVLGDKTPRNVYQLPFLLSSFPEAKFIHIVRDPRDNVLSVKNTWNKNIFRAAYKWQQGIDSVKGINEDRGRLAEITYEKLLRDTEAVLRQLSAFIGISYQDGMDKLQKKVEGKGGEIDQKNFDKYLDELKNNEIKYIEQLTKKGLEKYNYKLEHKNIDFIAEPPSFKLVQWKLQDVLNLIAYNIKEHGLLKGFEKMQKARKHA